jgi:hypothetical protein
MILFTALQIMALHIPCDKIHVTVPAMKKWLISSEETSRTVVTCVQLLRTYVPIYYITVS